MRPETALQIATLPYPAKILWPNGRGHWAKKHSATTSAKIAAYAAVNGWLISNRRPVSISALRFTLHPKPKGPVPDRDNIVAAMKAYQDGVCGALKINDATLGVPEIVIADRCKGGAVVVEIVP
jgi:crossover junction endodeoxyribonuclease RusA